MALSASSGRSRSAKSAAPMTGPKAAAFGAENGSFGGRTTAVGQIRHWVIVGATDRSPFKAFHLRPEGQKSWPRRSEQISKVFKWILRGQITGPDL